MSWGGEANMYEGDGQNESYGPLDPLTAAHRDFLELDSEMGPIFYPRQCPLCNIWVDSHYQWELHVNGKRHREMEYRSLPKDLRGPPPKLVMGGKGKKIKKKKIKLSYAARVRMSKLAKKAKKERK